jgi:hypothetical protein
MFLELGNLRDQEERRIARELGKKVDYWECMVCMAGPHFKGRECWKDSRRRLVQFHPDVPPVLIDKATLRAVLPKEEPLRYLRGKVRSNGKEICPVPVALHTVTRGTHDEDIATDIARLRAIEQDLEKWHVAPFAGPSLEWPRDLLQVLRHIRVMNGIIQMRNLSEQEQDQKPDDKRES